ncbi:hypothetical protein [Nocardiopsis deserti]|uniref:hypothetical protein n=1 Tax=Nocardiopsis deserti TaxID=2605988 RepID=UPI001239819C|nr:hypothetical protein [Nocardiopsis deserti]
MGNENLRKIFFEYGIWRLSEIIYVRLFPGLGGLGALIVRLRRRAREEGVSVREAKEIFFLDMVLTSLYVMPLALLTEAFYQFFQLTSISNFDRDYYYAWCFLFAAPAIGVTIVRGVESAKAVVVGFMKGNSEVIFALGRNSYAAIHLAATSVVLYGFFLNMFRAFGY